MHALPALHDTPVRVASVVPDGSEIGWMCQAEPSHRSARTLSGKKFELELE